MEKFKKSELVKINPHRAKRNSNFEGTFKVIDVPFSDWRKSFRKIYNLVAVDANGQIEPKSQVLSLSQRNLVKI